MTTSRRTTVTYRLVPMTANHRAYAVLEGDGTGVDSVVAMGNQTAMERLYDRLVLKAALREALDRATTWTAVRPSRDLAAVVTAVARALDRQAYW